MKSRAELEAEQLNQGMNRGSQDVRQSFDRQAREGNLLQQLAARKEMQDKDLANKQAMQKEALRMFLTPAQKAAEAAAGKSIAQYEAGGGSAGLEKDLAALREVQNQLSPDEQGKTQRGMWDRVSGSMAPDALLGLINPSEKARRDAAWNTALSLAKKSDPNPSERQINRILAQIYDPSSTNEANRERIARFLSQSEQEKAAIEGAKQRYEQTGYATQGGRPAGSKSYNPPAPPKAPPPTQAPVRMQAPDGSIKLVPANMVETALQQGGKRVD